LKRFIRISFAVISLLVAIVYGLACFTPYISPASFWLMGFLGLAFPVLLILVLVTALVWLFVNRKTGIALLALVCVGYKNISVLFAWNNPQKFSVVKPAGTVRILSWNVKGFDTQEYYRDSANSVRHTMLRYIAAQDADILCLQDFTEYDNPRLPSNIGYITDTLHYPYHYFADDYKMYPAWGPAYWGIVLFSRFPFSHTQKVAYPGKSLPESIILADISIGNKSKRLVMTHLQSMHLRQAMQKEKEAWDNSEDNDIVYSNNLFKKLQYFMPYHALQSELVKKQIAESPHPVIFSADMNEVPTSFAYHNIKGNMKDAFLAKGIGFGRTYSKISPTLRIDYLMVSPTIEVTQYKKDDIYMSDHYPHVMDVKW